MVWSSTGPRPVRLNRLAHRAGGGPCPAGPAARQRRTGSLWPSSRRRAAPLPADSPASAWPAWRAPGRRSPAMRAEPVSGSRKPVRSRMVVDLPAPLGPRKPSTSPARDRGGLMPVHGPGAYRRLLLSPTASIQRCPSVSPSDLLSRSARQKATLSQMNMPSCKAGDGMISCGAPVVRRQPRAGTSRTCRRAGESAAARLGNRLAAVCRRPTGSVKGECQSAARRGRSDGSAAAFDVKNVAHDGAPEAQDDGRRVPGLGGDAEGTLGAFRWRSGGDVPRAGYPWPR